MMLLWGAVTCRRGSWARRTPAPAVPRSPGTAILAPSFLPSPCGARSGGRGTRDNREQETSSEFV